MSGPLLRSTFPLIVLGLAFGCGGGGGEELQAPVASPPPPTAEAPGAGSAGIGPSATDPSPGEGEAPEPPRAVADWTAGIVEVAPAETPTAGEIPILRDVRVTRHEGYDRVAFDFGFGPLPGFHVEYVDEPVRDCGSGAVHPLPGQGWLAVRFAPARAHGDAGEAASVATEAAAPGSPVLEVAPTCDFEGTTTWVLAVAAPNRFRVAAGADPETVLVDVRHDGAAGPSAP